jgi:hypothetical protein
MSGFGILGTTKPSVDDIADVLEAGVGTADLARVQSSVSGEANRGVTVTIPEGRVAADVSIPVRIDGQTLPVAWWAFVAAGGANIRASVGGAYVPIDVSYCNIGVQEATIWVRATVRATTPTVIVLTCTTATTAAPARHPSGMNAVWAGYSRVFTGDSTTDRTGSGAALTVSGRQAYNIVGRSPNLVGTHQGVAYDPLTDLYFAIDSTVITQFDSRYAATGPTLQLASLGIATANHFGQGVCLDGVLYVPVEFYNGPTVFNTQRLVALDCRTFAVRWVVDISAQGHEAAAVAYCPDDGLLYIASYADGTKLWRYTLSGTYVSSVTLSATLTSIQGLVYHAGKLYAAIEQPITGIKEINITTGAITAGWAFDLVTEAAPEGVTPTPAGIGLLHDSGFGSFLLHLSANGKRVFEGDLVATTAAAVGTVVPKYSTTALPSLAAQTWTMISMFRNVHTRRNQAVASISASGDATNAPRMTLAVRSTQKIACWDASNGWLDSNVTAALESTHVMQVAYSPTTRKVCANGTIVTGAVTSPRPISGNTPELRLMYESDTAGETAAGECAVVALVAGSVLTDATMQAIDAAWRNPASFYIVA